MISAWEYLEQSTDQWSMSQTNCLVNFSTIKLTSVTWKKYYQIKVNYTLFNPL